MDNENTTTDEMTKKLKAAGKKAEKAKTERQARAVKGAHLTERLLQLVYELGLVQEEKSGFIKVTATGRSGKLYIAKKGGRVDLAFPFAAEGIKQVTEEEAKARHLGKIRAQLDFDRDDDTILSAFAEALEAVKTSAEVAAKPARAPKAKSTEDEAEEQETEAVAS